MRRGISEKRIYAYNPLPMVTEAELCERAGLMIRADADRSFFDFKWRWGTGIDKEWIFIRVGDEPIELRESESRSLQRDLSEMGVVLLETPVTHKNHAEECHAKSLDGLRRAYDYWHNIGEKRIAKTMMKAGITRDQLDTFKQSEWIHFRNAEAAKEVMKEMERLKSEQKAAKKVA